MRIDLASLIAFMLLAANAFAADETATAGDDVLVVAEGELPKMWKYVRGRAPRFDAKLLREHGHACVTLGYVIEPDGRPSTIRVLKASPPEVFDATAIETLGKVRFKPGPSNDARVPVYSTMTYTAFRNMGGNAASEADRTAAHCAMRIVPPARR
jgi:TonB family protein